MEKIKIKSRITLLIFFIWGHFGPKKGGDLM